jgi:hypothetical protein
VETTSVQPVTTHETVCRIFICILDKKLSGRQIGRLTVMFYFMAYVNFSPYLPHFFKESFEIWYRRPPPRALEQPNSVKFGTVKAILYIRAQVIFLPHNFYIFFHFG